MDIEEYSNLAAGQRFELNLSDDEQDQSNIPTAPPAPLSLAFVKDITEREVDTATPPKFKATTTGFPEHRKRTKQSRFRQKHGNKDGSSGVSSDASSGHTAPRQQQSGSSMMQMERQQAEEDSSAALAAMSESEIAEARAELLSGMVPGVTQSLIEKLLKRAAVNEDQLDPLEPAKESKTREEDKIQNDTIEGQVDGGLPEEGPSSLSAKPNKTVTFSEDLAISTTRPTSQTQTKTRSFPPASDTAAPSQPPSDLYSPSSDLPPPELPPPTGTHFPSANPPTLDPSSPSFLTDLQSHYFPNLALDPSQLSWMAPVNPSPDGPDSTYSASSTSLSPRDLRFDFNGSLLPPSLSDQLPSHLGLHHHSLAPGSAGYTIPELCIFCKSKNSGQKCIGMQTLGRIMYKLGEGIFGPAGSDMYEGMWEIIEKDRGLDVILAEAAKEEGRGNRSVWAVATEASWNWRRGGGRKRVAE